MSRLHIDKFLLFTLLVSLLCACSVDPRVVQPNQRSAGIVFWEFPSISLKQAVNSNEVAGFQWIGPVVHAWDWQNGRQSVVSVQVSQCDGLEGALDSFRRALVPSATSLMSDTPRHGEIVIWHGSSFRVQVNPRYVSGVLTLDADDPYSQVWVQKAQLVQEMVKVCAASKI